MTEIYWICIVLATLGSDAPDDHRVPIRVGFIELIKNASQSESPDISSSRACGGGACTKKPQETKDLDKALPAKRACDPSLYAIHHW